VCKVRIPRSQWDHEIGHKHFVKDSAVSMRLRKPIPRSHWDRGIYEKKFQFYLRIFGCSLPEPHILSCQTQRSQWDRGIGSRSLNETAESDPAVSMRPRDPTWKFLSRFPWSQWDRGIGFRGLNETRGSVPAVSMWPRVRFPRSQWDRGNFMTPRNPYKNEYWFSLPLKGNHRKNQYICKHCIPIVTRKRQY
jgi:hypothetical protein